MPEPEPLALPAPSAEIERVSHPDYSTGTLLGGAAGLYEVIEPAQHGFGLLVIDCRTERRTVLLPSVVAGMRIVRDPPTVADAL
jgi:hypothetical protein